MLRGLRVNSAARALARMQGGAEGAEGDGRVPRAIQVVTVIDAEDEDWAGTRAAGPLAAAFCDKLTCRCAVAVQPGLCYAQGGSVSAQFQPQAAG
jgi:hypothetical protein